LGPAHESPPSPAGEATLSPADETAPSPAGGIPSPADEETSPSLASEIAPSPASETPRSPADETPPSPASETPHSLADEIPPSPAVEEQLSGGQREAIVGDRPVPPLATGIRELDRVVTRTDLDRLAEERACKPDKNGLVLLENEMIVWREGCLPAKIRTPIPWRLFKDLYRNLGQFRKNSHLISAVWEDEPEGDRTNLYVQLSALKIHLRRIHMEITNTRGCGYCLEMRPVPG